MTVSDRKEDVTMDEVLISVAVFPLQFSFTIEDVTYPINIVDFVVHVNDTTCVGGQ